MSDLQNTAQLVPVEVPGAGTILALDEGDSKWIAIRPMCERLGIDVQAQQRKLDQAEWACTALKAVHDASGRTQQMVMIDADHLPMWLASIQPSRVDQSIRQALITFQREATRALRDHFYQGVSVAPASNSFDVMRSMIDQLEATQRDAAEAKAIAATTEARLDAIEGQHDYFAALGYAKLHNLPTSTWHLRKMGGQASKIAKTYGVDPVPTQHALYGTVNSFPKWIWDLVAA
ncbi:hypothetical protein CH249_25920 [Rhodococcus sp. 05-2255-3B1]|uniref:phage antirepressor N-terminal domain-containing protein n=1 Tax=Rhodococcus sp. 05-2255-3B1 TaxID=2022482 RepID=UPI000B9AE1D1|nr:phage antirepressor N-terminal domain-containing protein [Rhodococcus sp. 05-2255-3B1]OZE04373.1 hypothetical protein CH249_25920 [Rhodococcus sp. 05-2255-3B1]